MIIKSILLCKPHAVQSDLPHWPQVTALPSKTYMAFALTWPLAFNYLVVFGSFVFNVADASIIIGIFITADLPIQYWPAESVLTNYIS